jgi:hypothetical protein
MSILFGNIQVGSVVDHGFGGEDFTRMSPHPGCAMVGLIVKSGAWIDRVTPIFAQLKEDGTFGLEFNGQSIGGEGGMTRRLLKLSPGHVAVGLQTRSGTYVDAVRLYEASWDGSTLGQPRWTDWIGGEGDAPERQAFMPPDGHVLIGVAGRAHRYLDALTGIAAAPERVVTATVGYDASSKRRSQQQQPTG